MTYPQPNYVHVPCLVFPSPTNSTPNVGALKYTTGASDGAFAGINYTQLPTTTLNASNAPARWRISLSVSASNGLQSSVNISSVLIDAAVGLGLQSSTVAFPSNVNVVALPRVSPSSNSGNNFGSQSSQPFSISYVSNSTFNIAALAVGRGVIDVKYPKSSAPNPSRTADDAIGYEVDVIVTE